MDEWMAQPRINHARRIADVLWDGKAYRHYLDVMEKYFDELTSEEKEKVRTAREKLGLGE